LESEKQYKLFYNASNIKSEIVEGDVKRYIYTGENIQTVEYHFPPNKVFPEHKHEDHEQIGFLVKGKMVFRIGNVERILKPGDYYHAPRGVVHNAWTLDEPAVLLDLFSPPRDDLV